MKKIIKIVHTLLLAFVFSFLLFLYIQHGPMAVVNISMSSILIVLILFLLSFVEITLSARRTYQVSGAPGALFMKMARYVYSQKTIEEVFEPTQRDFLDEYADAISDYILAESVATQSTASWWVIKVCSKYYFGFFSAVVRQNFITVFVRRVYQLIVGR
ncbi:MAG: hypothetical protein AB8G77_07155 [Rhodothermales bacterium]